MRPVSGRLPPALLLAVGVLLGTACSQAPPPVVSQVPETPESTPDPEPRETGPGEEAPAPDEPDPTVIVIERRADRDRDPKGEAEPRSLYEAARAAREERARSGPSRVVITDENLHEFQGEGLTFAEEEEAGEGGEEGAAAEGAGTAPEAPPEEARGEAYWRSRVRDLRLALREAVDSLAESEERAASLRRSFYAQDDPYLRDAEIKPAWDRALDRIAETRAAIFRLRDEIDATLEAGRRAGALPGWLREGIELEPEPEELPEPRQDGVHEPGEPQVMEIGEEPP